MAKIIKNCLKQFNSNVTSYLILWRLPRDQKKKKNLCIFTKFYTSKISLKIFIDFLQRKFRNTVFFFQFQLKMYRSPKAIKAYLTNSNLYTDCSGISWCCSFFPLTKSSDNLNYERCSLNFIFLQHIKWNGEKYLFFLSI